MPYLRFFRYNQNMILLPDKRRSIHHDFSKSYSFNIQGNRFQTNPILQNMNRNEFRLKSNGANTQQIITCITCFYLIMPHTISTNTSHESRIRMQQTYCGIRQTIVIFIPNGSTYVLRSQTRERKREYQYG